MTPQQVEELIRAAMQNSQNNFMQQIQNLTQQLQELQPPQIVILHPITIQRNIPSGDCTLHLIKSLPEFNGDNMHALRGVIRRNSPWNIIKKGQENSMLLQEFCAIK